MLKKNTLFVLFIGFLMLCVCSTAWAVVYGTPAVYLVTISRVEISKDGGATWVTVGSGNLTFDIASATAGAAVGNYCTNDNVEAGTYNKMRVTVSRTFTIRGNVLQNVGANAGNRMYTSPNGSTTVAANAGNQTVTCPTTDLPAKISLSPAGSFYYTEDTNFTVSDTATERTLTVSFNVTNAMSLEADDSFFPQPPSMTVSVNQ